MPFAGLGLPTAARLQVRDLASRCADVPLEILPVFALLPQPHPRLFPVRELDASGFEGTLNIVKNAIVKEFVCLAQTPRGWLWPLLPHEQEGLETSSVDRERLGIAPATEAWTNLNRMSWPSEISHSDQAYTPCCEAQPCGGPAALPRTCCTGCAASSRCLPPAMYRQATTTASAMRTARMINGTALTLAGRAQRAHDDGGVARQGASIFLFSTYPAGKLAGFFVKCSALKLSRFG